MNKKEFLNQLKRELKYYKKIDTEEIIYYYDEMIQDAIDEGKDPATFIKNLGSIDAVVSNVVRDGDFMVEVKTSNNNSITNILNGTVKLISYLAYIFAIFVLGIVSISIIISGAAMIIQSSIYLILNNLTVNDQWILIGIIVMGIGIGLIGIAIFKNLIKTSQSIRLFVTRRTKQIFKKREVNHYE